MNPSQSQHQHARVLSFSTNNGPGSDTNVSKFSISTKCKPSQLVDDQYKEIMRLLHDQSIQFKQLDHRIKTMQLVGALSLGVASCNYLIGLLMFLPDAHIVT